MGNDEIEIVSAKATFWKKGAPAESKPEKNTINVSFYQIDDIKAIRPKYKTSESIIEESKLLKRLDISTSGDEWLELNVTETVRTWLNNSKSARTGILIRCEDCASTGIIIRTGGNYHVPVLHIQTRMTATKRVKRSRDLRRATRTKLRKLGDCLDAPKIGRHSSKCCRRSMTVRFDDLPNFDFIVAPKEFDAYYCSGKCPPRYNPANEHALLQSLLNMQKKRSIPKPCCAPTDLKGLHILHFDDRGKLKTNLWSDVIVTECGCT